jgi:hypothetical protein
MNGTNGHGSEPLGEQTLISALGAAASSNIVQIKAGTAQLQSWETTPGYFGLLQVCLSLQAASV